METFEKISPEFFREIRDEKLGLKGFLVIDKQIHGTATGGIRMATDVSREEIANLAREMTLKYALFKMKKDGAKAGIIAPRDQDSKSKKDLCRAFGEQISDLVTKKMYFPGEDLGIAAKDLNEILIGAGVEQGHKKNGIRSEYFTALTVFLTIQELLGHYQMLFSKSTMILEGFGKVAEHLLRFLTGQQAKVIGVSTVNGAVFAPQGLDPEQLLAMKDQFGDSFVLRMKGVQKMNKEDLLVQTCDVFVPGARPDSINAKNVNDIKARFVVAIANIATTEAMEETLEKRGIIFVPGFLSNAGGVLGHFLNEQGFSVGACEKILREFFPVKVRRLIREAEKEGQFLSAKARSEAWKNLESQEREARGQLRSKITAPKALWLAHKKLSRFGLGFFLNSFAENYVGRRHLT